MAHEMDVSRRNFLRTAALVSAASSSQGAAALNAVTVIVAPDDPIASSAPVVLAVAELEQALKTRQVAMRMHQNLQQAAAGDLCVLVAGSKTRVAREVLSTARASVPDAPEVVALAAGNTGGRSILLASGSDVRGLVFAVLELADRVRHGAQPIAAMQVSGATIEQPANRVRSIARYFESDVEDKAWFYDRGMWAEYLSMLASQRINRFNLSFGLGYNFPRNVSDVYLYFSYPFLLSVPGYDVRATGLPDTERERNLEMLRFIGDETVKRGMEFQLGLWTHAYQWVDSPRANYVITGLDAENHAPYCRDAIHALLQACPAISGVTLRIHGESGVPEGNYDFWKTLFDGIVRSGRQIEIDMHAKGMDQKMIDVALATGMPVKVSPKYWAEHMGLPYHQAAIRELEMPPRDRKVEGVFALSNGERRFLRYGYGDLIKENRQYGIVYRIWPGTQRFLLWGDPAMAAGYSRYSNFCGSDGVELCEPLSFKGRIGSGQPGGRCAYADKSLNPKYDWQKYLYTYRLWGRLTYNPDADPDAWRRYLKAEFADASLPLEAALANASRILPLVTTTHGTSGSNNTYWPEIYTNMPIVDPTRKQPYRDSPAPLVYGNVSPFDPQLFSRINDFAAELMKSDRSGRYSPLDVSQWLEELSTMAAKHLAKAEHAATRNNPEFRRASVDVAIQSGLGRFFAFKTRAAVLWALYDRTGDQNALKHAIEAYRTARTAWAELADRAKGVYVTDITYGATPHLRGHWLDRLQAIDDDIADMQKRFEAAESHRTASTAQAAKAIREVLGRPARLELTCRHSPPKRFQPGKPLDLELSLEKNGGHSVRMQYRHVDQAEQWQTATMALRDRNYRATVAADYTNSPYPLQYYFEIRNGDGLVSLYPGFEVTLSNQPYFVVRQA